MPPLENIHTENRYGVVILGKLIPLRALDLFFSSPLLFSSHVIPWPLVPYWLCLEDILE